MQPFSFTLESTDPKSGARAGSFETPHGPVQTPVFMPVGTQATVKALSPAELVGCGSSCILANTYHLHLRPGDELIREAGGLHAFTTWKRAMLTDSGGFQVFSLRDISKISDDGVTFRSHIDGSERFFSPERVMAIEHNLGADIIMAFDECPPAKADASHIGNAVDRTIRWANQCREAHERLPFHHGYPQALFGIVQGGTVESLRTPLRHRACRHGLSRLCHRRPCGRGGDREYATGWHRLRRGCFPSVNLVTLWASGRRWIFLSASNGASICSIACFQRAMRAMGPHLPVKAR